MSQRFQGMLIWLLLIGWAFLFINPDSKTWSDNLEDKNKKSTQIITWIVCEPGNCGPRCGDHARTASELLNSRITCRQNDDNCIEVVADPCPQELAFEEVWSWQRIKLITYWVGIYQHLDEFLKEYDTPECHKTRDACYEMYNVKLFNIDDKQIEELVDEWESLLWVATPHLIWDTSNQIQKVRDRFDPILHEIQRLMRTNYGLINVKEYHQEVIPLLRGMQYRIKYALVDYFIADRQLLPWKISLTQDDSPH